MARAPPLPQPLRSNGPHIWSSSASLTGRNQIIESRDLRAESVHRILTNWIRCECNGTHFMSLTVHITRHVDRRRTIDLCVCALEWWFFFIRLRFEFPWQNWWRSPRGPIDRTRRNAIYVSAIDICKRTNMRPICGIIWFRDGNW